MWNKESIVDAHAMADEVDAVLLGSGCLTRSAKETGGTERVHDWALSRAIVRALGIPVFLASGIGAENAAGTVNLFGVNLCTGIKTNDRLDSAKPGSFCAAIKASNG